MKVLGLLKTAFSSVIKIFAVLCVITIIFMSIIRIMKSRRMGWMEPVARMGEKRNVYMLLVGKMPLGRPRRGWVDNIRMDLREVR
jgi:hypothetical protein